MTDRKTWEDQPIGADLPPATSLEYKTGGWRSMRPIFNASECIQCMICVSFCPDMTIPVRKTDEGVIGKGGKTFKGVVRLETNLDYCKGCGICAHECPSKAITMVREEEAEQAACKP
jgi:pyruvate ferredoxin oxidoreductase delta subunit